MDNFGVRVESILNCYLCGGKGEKLYCGLKDHLFSAPGVWDLVECSECGLVWLNPHPYPEDIHRLYSSYYTHISPTEDRGFVSSIKKKLKQEILSGSFGYTDLKSTRWLGKILSLIGPLRDLVGSKVRWLNFSNGSKLLDVGCGSGGFLYQMKKLGWEVTGVEPDIGAVKVARELLNLNVHEGNLENLDLPEKYFDVVTINHVIEHVLDPVGFLMKISSLLKDKGTVIVITPNTGSLGRKVFDVSWRGWDTPRHIFLFSLPTLKKCAEKADIRIRELKTTAVAARNIWHTGKFIKKEGKHFGSINKRLSNWIRVEGYLFFILEHLLLKLNKSCGEELVLIGGKGTFKQK